MRRNVVIGLCAALCFALVGFEVVRATGSGSTDATTFREPITRVVVDAEDGEVTLLRRTEDVHVWVKRHHLVNSPETEQSVSDGVLTLSTDCPLGFVACDTDYRVGVPADVEVEVSKSSAVIDKR